MSERLRTWIALGVIAASLGVVAVVLTTGPATPENRAQALATRLKCPVCESESIADSPAQVARDSFDLIEERIAAGWSDDEIIQSFVETYGRSVLLDPPASGATALLWLAPVGALAIGAVVVLGRRAVAARDVTDEERARIRAELEARR